MRNGILDNGLELEVGREVDEEEDEAARTRGPEESGAKIEHRVEG